MSPTVLAMTNEDYATAEQSKQPLLCWTVCGYRKPGMSEEAYHDYIGNVHGPLVRGLLAKHGMVSYSMIHISTQTRALMSRICDPQFANIADYDCVITATFRDIEDFVRFKADPEFIKNVAPDHENFADTKRSRMTIGWVEDHVKDGIVVAEESEPNADIVLGSA